MKEYLFLDYVSFIDAGEILNKYAKEGYRVVSHSLVDNSKESNRVYSFVLEKNIKDYL
jgi:hypothetical protein